MGLKLQILEGSKKIPVKFIKYEDLTKKTYSIVLEIIELIYKITNNTKKINKNK